MKTHRIGIFVAGLLTIGTVTALAQTSTPTVSDLARGTLTGAFDFEARDASDVVMHKIVYDAAAAGNTWHTHPPVAVIVKTGSLTVHTGDANGCTSKTYTAGQVSFDPGGVTHVHEGSPDVEAFVTYVGVPVGAPVAKDAAAPTGPNCPAKLNPGLARTELSRSTIQGPSHAAATGDSEMIMQLVTVPPGANFRGWYSSPAALFSSPKSGSLTLYTGNATTCTSQTSTAGRGRFVPANQVIFVRNEGSVPAEVYATRLGHPVGAPLRVDAQNPGAANCPDVAAAGTPAPATDLPRTGWPAEALVMLGLGLAAGGTVVRGVIRRR